LVPLHRAELLGEKSKRLEHSTIYPQGRNATMAGFSRMYVIGGLGGFEGADGINPIQLQIWVGNANRQWWQPHYVDRSIGRLSRIRSIVPSEPDHPDALLDACIVFHPHHFTDCPTLGYLMPLLKRVGKVLDFEHPSEDPSIKEIYELWPQLREEAWPRFRELNIFEAAFRAVSIQPCRA
jgi:hypothetical protein